MRARGYTLVEMVVAVAVLAIIAAAAIPLTGPVNENKLDAAAGEVANALRFARTEAIRTGSFRGVDFSVDPVTGKRRIRVFRTDAATPPNPVYDVYHPLDKKPYDIQLANGPGTQGATISAAAFLYFRPPFTFVTQDQAAFDASGNPEYYPDAANYALTIDFFNPAQLAAWTIEGVDVQVSLNISARNLLDPAFVEDVRSAVDDAGVDARKVTLEITETAVMADPPRAGVVLAELASMGIGLSVDDFGIGHSSLAYLRRFPVTELKIDQSFVGDILVDPADAAIVRTTIELGRALGLWVVAEGVESAGVLAMLTTMGCDAAQGFHLARPMSASDAARLLARGPVPIS